MNHPPSSFLWRSACRDLLASGYGMSIPARSILHVVETRAQSRLLMSSKAYHKWIESTLVVYKRIMSASGSANADHVALSTGNKDAKCHIQLIASMLYGFCTRIEHLLVRISQGLLGCTGVTEIREIEVTLCENFRLHKCCASL